MELENNGTVEQQVSHVKGWEAGRAESLVCRDDFRLGRRTRYTPLLFDLSPYGVGRVGSEQVQIETARRP